MFVKYLIFNALFPDNVIIINNIAVYATTCTISYIKPDNPYYKVNVCSLYIVAYLVSMHRRNSITPSIGNDMFCSSIRVR